MLLKRFTEAIMELDGSPDFSRIMFVCRLVDECPMTLIQITTSKQYKYSTYTPVRIRFHRLCTFCMWRCHSYQTAATSNMTNVTTEAGKSRTSN